MIDISIIKRIAYCCLGIFQIFCLASCIQKYSEITLPSPDFKIEFRLTLENGIPSYTVFCDNTVILRKSSFSFEFKNQPPLGTQLQIVDVKKSSCDETWNPVLGFSSSIRNNYNETWITFQEIDQNRRIIQLIARAYDNGIAFRYIIAGIHNQDSLFITNENSEFNFTSNDSAWWIPANEFAYESLYRHTPIDKITDANTPFTIERNDGLALSIHEAALINYSEMTLKKAKADSLSFISSLWPEPDGVCARVKAPFTTPWRVIMIARTPGELIESHLIQNLNEPNRITDYSWIKPMKFVGIWWGMHLGKYTWFQGPKHGATTKRTKEYIDFAATHHIEGVLAEGWNVGWESWAPGKTPLQNFCKATPDFNLEEVVKYSKSKNVQFISHHETGGNIPVYEAQLEDAFSLCQRLGITTVKTGYAGSILPSGYHHHGQFMVRHFQKVVETAAKYHVALDVHESIKPTGLDRTWPNLVSQEAIRGNEWNATYKATPPQHVTILPFTRFLAGPADYTPGIFRVNHSPEKNKRLYCTLTNQLALYVIFYSPLMMVSDMIENYSNSPAFKFIEKVPCTWDETKVIIASIGHYVTIARRSKDRWFIGSVTDEESRTLSIPLPFLEKGRKYIATVYGDSKLTNWEKDPEKVEIGNYLVTASDTIIAPLSRASGNAITIYPVEKESSDNFPSIAVYNTSTQEKMNVFKTIKPLGCSGIKHLALNKPINFKYPFNEKYPASGKSALTDGIKGSYNYSSGEWQGFEGVDLEATIDLVESKQVQKVSIGFLSSIDDWIFLPTKVEFYTSSDNKSFMKVGEIHHANSKPASNANSVQIKDFSVSISQENIRFVRVIGKGVLRCPEWHPGKGGKAWLFCDEIVVE